MVVKVKIAPKATTALVMGDAGESIGLIVEAGTKDYVIVVGLTPNADPIPTYAIRNKTTLVDEWWGNYLPKAKFMMAEMQKDLDHGFDRESDAEPGSIAQALFGKKPRAPGPKAN